MKLIRPFPLSTFFLALVLQACSPAVPPEEVVSRFWAASLTGDHETVRQLALPDHFEEAHFRTARHSELFSTVVIGQVNRQRERALVETRLEGIAYGEPAEVEFATVAVIHEGEWKIDYSATASEMIGALLEEAVIEVDALMRDDILELEESFNESIRQDLRSPD